MPDPTRLYLVHHAMTPYDQGGPGERLTGWKPLGLTDEGRTRAQETADWLKNKGVGEVYSSDLPRAKQTGDILAKTLGTENTPRRNLRSWDVGMAVGVPTEDAETMLQDYRTRRWANIPGGESYGKFLSRFGSGLNQLIQDALAEEQRCVAVLHSVGFHALPHLLSAGKQPIDPSLSPEPGGVMALDIADGGKRLKLSTVHDYEPVTT